MGAAKRKPYFPKKSKVKNWVIGTGAAAALAGSIYAAGPKLMKHAGKLREPLRTHVQTTSKNAKYQAGSITKAAKKVGGKARENAVPIGGTAAVLGAWWIRSKIKKKRKDKGSFRRTLGK